VDKYGAAYTKAFSGAGRNLKKYYIDAFSGAGVHLSKRTKSPIEGSPSRALKVNPPFDAFYFIDMDAGKTANLQQLCRSRTDVHIHTGDANDYPTRKLLPTVHYDKFNRALCLLDPYGRLLAGIDLTGQIEFIDLAKDAPHLLVAGVPGGGKSEWLRAAAASLMVTNGPDTLRLILIDPKKNAFGELNGSTYLWRPDALIDTPDGSVIRVLIELIAEMQRRNDLFARVAADNLYDYYLKTKQQLPRLVCIVDEYAELLMGAQRRPTVSKLKQASCGSLNWVAPRGFTSYSRHSARAGR
jgi:hypothetical protein